MKHLLKEERYALKKLKAVSFPATDEMLCREFVDGHRVALKKSGILNVTSNNEEWIGEQSIHCLMITNEEDEPVAGLRIEAFVPTRKVPMQDISEDLTQRIDAFVQKKFSSARLAELCALWVHPEYRSNKMAIEITTLGIAKSFGLDINDLVLIGAQHSEKISDKVGFVRCSEVMMDEPFLTYPNPEYKAVVRQLFNISDSIYSLKNDDEENLSDVEAAYERIRKYLLRPRGVTFVKSSDKIYSILYDLRK